MSFTLLTPLYFLPDGFPIAIRRMEPQDACPLHDHDFCEIAIVTCGEGVHVTDRNRMPLRRGTVLVIDAHRLHAYEQVEELSLINILFSASILDKFHSDLGALPGYRSLFGAATATGHASSFHSTCFLDQMKLGEALAIVAKMEGELRERSPGFQLAAQSAFMSLVLFLSRSHRPSGKNSEDRAATPDTPHRIQAAIREFHEHYAEPIDLNLFPRLQGMSQRNFRRAFHQVTGFAPIEYLNRIRVQEAAMQLRCAGPSITEVAMRVGFNDLSFFGRKFKQVMGETPRGFREKLLNTRATRGGLAETVSRRR